MFRSDPNDLLITLLLSQKASIAANCRTVAEFAPMRFLGMNLPAFGALAVLSFTLGLMFLGPVDIFGIPDPKWAKFLLLPGIWVGILVNDLFRWPILACKAAGVCTMIAVGWFVGFLVEWVASGTRMKR